jgi:subtilase family protein/putative Ig domain-containing protein
MSSNRLAVAAVALIGLMAASETSPPLPALRHPAVPPGSARLMAFGGRSAAQIASGIGGKLDAALAELTRQAGRARPGHALEDLNSLSPAARFLQHGPAAEPLVAVDAVTRGDPQLLKAALVRLGLEHPAVFRNDVGGWLPVSAIDAAAARAEVDSLRAALSRARVPVATQGDYAQDSATMRALEGLNGSGVTVGVLSSSYDCYSVYAAAALAGQPLPAPPVLGPTGYASNTFTADAASDVSTGALPVGVNVLEEAFGTFGMAGSQGCVANYGYPLQLPFADEGRAMLQIVHAVAPSAGLAFYTAVNSEADFANGILRLASATASGGAGAKVIADDVGYFDEPFFQDGIVAQAIDTVAAQGVAYFSAAGNDSNIAYDNTAPKFTIAGSGAQAGEMLLNFDATGKTSAPALTVSVPALVPGEFIAAVLEWDQPYLTGAYPGTAGSTPGATSQIDLCVTAPGLSIVNENGQAATTCTGLNAKGTDPLQVLIVANPAYVNGTVNGNSAPTNVSLMVGLANGSPAPGRIKLVWQDDGAGSTITNFPPTNNATIQGHPNAAGAAAVGAARFYETPLCGTTPAVLEPFSSFGGTPILFDSSGNRLATPDLRQKPDFVTADAVNNTFLGFTLASANLTDPSTVQQCMNNASYPNFFGTSAAAPHAAGLAALLLQANSSITPGDVYTALRFTAAPMVTASPDFTTGYGMLQAGPALAWPNMSVSPATITVGQSATLTWNAASLNTCTATAGFSSNAISGSMSVTPTAVGTSTYTMKCTNAAGNATESVALVVQAALSVTTTSLASGQVGAAYSAMLAASGGTTPYTWTLTSGTLPAGLSLASSGAITGTPTASASNVALTFKVTDSSSPAQSTTASLSLTIAPASSGGGGGGALGVWTLVALTGLGLGRALRAARARH